MQTYVKRALSAVLVCVILLTAGACAVKVPPTILNMLAFDTTITITLYGAFTQAKSQYLNECKNMLERYEKILSAHAKDSELYKLNASSGGEMCDELARVVALGLEYSKKTNGAFDITLGALNELWNVTERTTPPTPEEIQIAKAQCGYSLLTLNGNTAVYGASGMKIDLGGIAKGYVADKLREYLLSVGITSGAIITLGGGVLCIGDKDATANAYKIAMQDPKTGGLQDKYLFVKDTAVTSSGNYERYFEYNGVQYCHIIDPETGCPVTTREPMVTVVCKSAVLGDVLSTALYVVGREKTQTLTTAFPEVEQVVWTDEGE